MGSDFSSPIMGPFLRALKIKAFVEDLDAQKEERQMRRERMRLELDEQKHNRMMQDFSTGITLHNLGALPVGQGDEKVEGALTEAMGPTTPESTREKVDVPFSSGTKQYRLPSRVDVARRAEESAKVEATGEYAKAYARKSGESRAEEESGGLLPITFPAMNGQPETTLRVSRKEYPAAVRALRDVNSKKYSAHNIETDDEGNATFVGIPADGGAPEKIDLGKIGKSKTLPAGEAEALPDFDSRVKQKMDQWRPGFYATLKITDQEPEGPTAAKAWKEEKAKAEDQLYKRAVDSVKSEGKVAAAGAKKKGAADKGSGSVDDSLNALIKAGKTSIAAKNVPAAAKHLGISNEEFSRRWHSLGGHIMP